MQTKLEKCGNLAVPVDESGTATGRPEPSWNSRLSMRLAELIRSEPDTISYPGLHMFWEGQVSELKRCLDNVG